MSRKLLAQSANYRLVYEWDTPILIDMRDNTEHALRKHYGDPSCAIIDEDAKLCFTGGDGLSVFSFETGEECDFLDQLSVHSMKKTDSNKVKILIDPWCDDHGVWVLDMRDLSILKVSDQPDLREMPYRETVDY